MTADIWERYYRRFEKMDTRMCKMLQRVAGHFPGVLVEPDNAGDYGFTMEIPRERGPENDRLGITFHIIDAGEAGDDDPGKRGNFNLSVIGPGGRIVGVVIPFNFTPKVWVRYGNDAEWRRRMRIFETDEFMVELVRIIREWQDEAEEAA